MFFQLFHCETELHFFLNLLEFALKKYVPNTKCCRTQIKLLHQACSETVIKSASKSLQALALPVNYWLSDAVSSTLLYYLLFKDAKYKLSPSPKLM